MKALRLWSTAAFFTAFSSISAHAQAFPGDVAYQGALEGRNAAFQLCQQGFAQQCQVVEMFPQFVAGLNQLRNACYQGSQQACAELQRHDANALQFARNRALSYQPQARSNGYPSPGQTLSEANDITANTGRTILNGNSTTGVVDSIWDRQRVQNPNTGNGYIVDGYNDNVWINEGNGTYLGTDNPNYNPNFGNGTYSGDWFLTD